MGYRYDVFLSYKNGPYGDWVHQIFYDLFQGHLNTTLGRQAEIFLDKNRIDVGDEWPLTLKHALADSRCLVSIWSYAYFTSQWCIRELNMMRRREKQYGFRIETEHGLIFPIVVHDGDRFPEFTRSIQKVECHKLARVGDAFKASKEYLELQNLVCELVEVVRESIEMAPDWNQEWHNIDWIDDEEIPVSPPVKSFEPPKLG